MKRRAGCSGTHPIKVASLHLLVVATAFAIFAAVSAFAQAIDYTCETFPNGGLLGANGSGNFDPYGPDNPNFATGGTGFVDLNAGDTITITADAVADVVYRVTLTSGPTSPQTLFALGPGPVNLVFIAPQDGVYFIFLEMGFIGAFTESSFRGNCVSAASNDVGSEALAFLARRLDRILASDPDRSRFIRRLNGMANGGGGPLSFSASPDLGSATFSTSLNRVAAAFAPLGGEFPSQALAYDSPAGPSENAAHLTDIWIEGSYSHYSDDLAGGGRDGDFGIIHFGMDHLLTENVLIGGLVSVDIMSESSSSLASDIEGLGWMAGPYAAIRLAPGVYLDLRAAWGQSDNDITVAGDSGNFDTDRWLARANLTGTWRSGPWRFTPTVGVAYIEEQQDAYTTSGGTAVPAQDIALGRLSFGPEIAYQYLCTNGFIVEPQILLTGNWDFERAEDITLGGVTGSPSEWHATFAAGVMIQAPTGHALRLEANYGGIGAGDFEAFGARAWFNAPLN
jgi:hypothetical protein